MRRENRQTVGISIGTMAQMRIVVEIEYSGAQLANWRMMLCMFWEKKMT